jgi:hypothetical protein
MLFLKLKLANCARPDYLAGRFDFSDRVLLVPRLLPLVVALVPGKRPLRGSIEFKREFQRVSKPACNWLYLTSPVGWSAPRNRRDTF